MTAFFSFLSTFLYCSTIFGLSLVVALSMPKSKFRTVLRGFVGVGGTVLCGLYVVCPIDLFPEAVLGPIGYIDDVGAVIAGIFSLMQAINAHRTYQMEYRDDDRPTEPYRTETRNPSATQLIVRRSER